MSQVYLLLFLSWLYNSQTAKATIITQRPLLIMKKGDSAVLDCEQDGSDYTMSWYRQAPDRAWSSSTIQLLLAQRRGSNPSRTDSQLRDLT
ncbi:hypothetical protein HHUSO_G21630 [Huso huso]|uniref:Immunoglobulin V-set domain-containing protein n=1 Tax=Huso huso TaxID=61971 RepID=A0ABR0YZB7_HUSHU